MSTKTIRIKVDKTGAQRALNEVNKSLGSVGLKADIATGSFNGMAGKAALAASAVAGAGAAIAIAAKAAIGLATSTAAAVVEMDNLAKRSGIATDTFQAWAAESKKLGVNNDQLADTFQDVSDRIGEFVRNWQRTGDALSGGGEFTDIYTQYLEPMNIGIEELQNLKPDEVLNLVKKGMIEAGAGTNEMISAFEQLASNSSWVIPLLDGTGNSMKFIKDQMQREGILFTDDDVTNARILDEKAKDLATKWDSVINKIALAGARPASEFLQFLDDSITKTQRLITETQNWIDKLPKGINLSSMLPYAGLDVAKGLIGGKDESLGSERIPKSSPVNKQGLLSEFGGDSEVKETADDIAWRKQQEKDAKEAEAADRRAQLEADARAKQLEAQKEAAAAYIEVIEQRNMDEFELLDAKNAAETEKLNQFREIGAISDAEYKAASLELQQSYADSLYAIMENESNREAALRKRDAEDEQKSKDKAARDAANKRKGEQKDMVNMAYQTNSMLDNAAKLAQGRSDKLNALAQGAAIFQATINMYSAAANAMNDPTAITPIQKAANIAMVLGMGANLLSQIQGATSRQSGGYMQANTPYQVGGGAHTDTPEMYQSGGKSYIVDSQAGMMKRVSGNASSGGGAINMQLINNGEPMSYTMQQDSIDEQGVRNIVMEMTPQILRDQAGNDQSDFSKAFGSIRNQDWSFT